MSVAVSLRRIAASSSSSASKRNHSCWPSFWNNGSTAAAGVCRPRLRVVRVAAAAADVPGALFPLVGQHHRGGPGSWQQRSFSSSSHSRGTATVNPEQLTSSSVDSIPSTNDTTTSKAEDLTESSVAAAAAKSSTKKASSGSTVSAYADLAKARLTALVVATTAAGFVAAGPLPLATDPTALASVVAGTALCSASAAAWNQIWELPRDAQMKRTVHRPLVSGALSQRQAVAAATVWGAGGAALLWFGTDPVTTALGVGNIALYAGPYTALKPVSTFNTWVGAVVGAIPPVMGYSAATAIATATTTATATTATATTSPFLLLLLDPIALTLGATLYLWQLPHFLALSYMYRADYSRGGFAMLPCHTITGAPSADAAARETATVMVRYAWYLAAVPVAATAAGVTGPMYAVEGLLLNAHAVRLAHRFHRHRTNQNARQVFLTSLWYLPCTLMLFLLHSKTWDEQAVVESTTNNNIINTNSNNNNNALTQFVSDKIRAVRAKGRELCWHEQAAAAQGPQACPSVVGKEKARETVDQAAERLTAVDVDVAAAKEKLENKQ